MHTFMFSHSLDIGFLDSIYDGDISYAEEIFSNFLIVLPSSMIEIQNAEKMGDTEAFKSVFHRIKPSFSYVGLTEITAEMDALQKECQLIDKIDEIAIIYQPLLKQISEKLFLVQQELQRIREFNNQQS